MVIISHRGYWKVETERNSHFAFERSFSSGFGIETDIRDFNGILVISHDIPNERSMSVKALFEFYNNFRTQLVIAINIKSDGLQSKLKELLHQYKIDNYFVFDMSATDGLSYLKHGFKFFTRQSEYENKPSFYDDAQGVWLDEFHRHWINEKIIKKHLKNGKKICIVSPELHGRSYLEEWNDYKKIIAKSGIADIMICTDYPAEAKEFFNG